MNFENNISISVSLSIIFLLLCASFIHSNDVFGDGKFSVEAKINLKSLNNPQKMKIVVYVNGQNETKYLTKTDLNSNTATVSFEFDKKTDIVTVGSRDEYFVCAYAVDLTTDKMQSYSCVEGNVEHENGKNTISIGTGSKKTLSSGKFIDVAGGEIKNPTIKVWVPLSDRKNTKELKVVAMIKGEFRSKVVNAQQLLKKSKDNTIIVPLEFNKTPEIGPIQQGDMLYACVSANELNPPEGTECEHRETSHTERVHNLVAR